MFPWEAMIYLFRGLPVRNMVGTEKYGLLGIQPMMIYFITHGKMAWSDTFPFEEGSLGKEDIYALQPYADKPYYELLAELLTENLPRQLQLPERTIQTTPTWSGTEAK